MPKDSVSLDADGRVKDGDGDNIRRDKAILIILIVLLSFLTEILCEAIESTGLGDDLAGEMWTGE